MIDEDKVEDVYKLVRAFCHKWNIYSEELVQMLVWEVWQKIDSFDPEKGKLSTYVYKLCKNIVLMEERKKKIEIVKSDEVIDKLKSQEIGPLEKLIQDEQDEIIHELYENCSPELKLWLAGLPQQEIAAIVGVSQAQISRRFKKEINEMRKKVILS